jgi:non-ribosomal peptide synthetase component E (peptide arylation enzyme)
MSDGKVIQLWGMSELQAGTYGRPNDDARIRLETAGRPSPGTALRILAEDAQGRWQAAPAGTEGRLQVRGPSLFGGYLDNPQATAAAFVDGWFDTGDTGYLTADGALVLTGRTKEIINRGGVKFNPIDVEAVIDQLPGVVRCAVVPMPDPVLGERACVFVQTAGPPITLARITAELQQAGIARFKWPERLELVAQMPLTPTQKIMRARLVAKLAQAASAPKRSVEDSK